MAGPLIVLGEGRLDFAEICCGVSGPKMSHFGPSVSEKVIYPRLFCSESGNLAPISTKSSIILVYFGGFRWFWLKFSALDTLVSGFLI